MSRENLLGKILGSNENDSQPLFDANEMAIGRFIYDVACEMFKPDQNNSDADDTASGVSFEEKVTATRGNFKRILELFKQSSTARNAFVNNYEKWAPECISKVKALREIAEDIHRDKFNCDVAKLVSAVVSLLGGIALALSYFTPLAAYTVPLTIGGGVACGVGGVATLGTAVTQMVRLKKKMEEVKKVIQQHEETFSLMADWFAVPEELQNELNSLVDHSVLKEVGEDLKNFFADVERASQMTIGDFKIRFKEVLKLCMGKMNKSGKVTAEFGGVFTPVVMVFTFLSCLLKGRNRMILDCVMINMSLLASINAVLNMGVPACLGNAFAKGAGEVGEDSFKVLFSKIVIGIKIVVDAIYVVLTSIELKKRVEPEQTKKIKDAADKLEEMFRALENVYKATKKYDSEAPKKWTAIIVTSIPEDAKEEDIRNAVETYLPYKAQDYIQLKRLETDGNNWTVKVPESDSELLLQMSDLMIKEQRCFLIK